MPTTAFTVSLVLENIEFTDAELDRLFEALPDAVPADVGGLITVTTPVDAANAESAVFNLVEVMSRVFPNATVVRLDQDLVSISDIADRTERSRESIRLLVEAKRGPGGFPSPVGTVGDGIRVWPWASILEWFLNVLGEDLGEQGVLPEVAALADACLAARQPHLTHRFQAAWSSRVEPASSVHTEINQDAHALR